MGKLPWFFHISWPQLPSVSLSWAQWIWPPGHTCHGHGSCVPFETSLYQSVDSIMSYVHFMSISCLFHVYPLVNCPITMEHHHCSWEHHHFFEWENQVFLWPFSIAMFDITRVSSRWLSGPRAHVHGSGPHAQRHGSSGHFLYLGSIPTGAWKGSLCIWKSILLRSIQGYYFLDYPFYGKILVRPIEP